MDISLKYLLVICGAVAAAPLYALIRWLGRWLAPRLRVSATRLEHSRLRFLPRSWDVTWPRLLFVLLLVALNAIFLSIDVRDVEADLERRTAFAASVNLMLLLLGGRTNPLVDLVQIPLGSYQFGHRCVGAVAVTEAFLHSGLVLRRRRDIDALATSGIMVCGPAMPVALSLTHLQAAGALLCLLVAYLLFLRTHWPYSGLVHLTLALTAMAGWTWHALLQQSSTTPRVLALVSCGLWCSTHLYRLCRIYLLGRTRAVVVDYWEDAKIVSPILTASRPVGVIPGCYFYPRVVVPP